MNFNPLGSYYCIPVLSPYSTFVYRASRLKRAPCLIYIYKYILFFFFLNPCMVINVISYSVWFLPIFPLTLFSPLVSVYHPLGPGV